MNEFSRLIEHAFPLKQTSLDSVHEKNVRHGHISTLHIWPARRPLAACRAALIATLLPDPGTPEKRKELCEKIGGRAVKKIEKKKMPSGETVDREKWETEGGVLHWLGDEPTSGGKKKREAWKQRSRQYEADMEWFRHEIKKAYGGRAPKVLDPFAGGGAIPLEAMRLGCEATAVDINPVAWFILKCTLEYPQKLAGQMRPLPEFVLKNRDFMTAFLKAKDLTGAQIGRKLADLGHRNDDLGGLDLKFGNEDEMFQADLAWHVRAWGQWVLDRARRDLAQYYPTYADFEPIKKDQVAYEHQPMRLLPPKNDGTPDIESLNAEFTEDYLADKRNPRWVAKPTVAYLWARTVTCKNCRSQLPLLKTRWLSKKDPKRVLLTIQTQDIEARPSAETVESARAKIVAHFASPASASVVENPSKTKRVVFGIQANVPVQGRNAAQRREHDKRVAAGTMSRAGAKCPCCPAIMTMEDIRVEGKANRLGSVMTAVVVDGPDGKEYRLPTEHELAVTTPDEARIEQAFKDVPFGVPDEPTPSADALGMRVPLYGFDKWRKLFTARQLTALGTFVSATRQARQSLATAGYTAEWIEGIYAGLAIGVDRIVDRQSTICRWDMGYTKLQGTFTRFALPITWDYCEGNPFSDTTGNYASNLEWVAEYWEHAALATSKSPAPHVTRRSAIEKAESGFDTIVTDPPYYDAIPYSDLMDFFYIWLRRTLHGSNVAISTAFGERLSPKWSNEANDGELIDDSSRHGNDAAKSRQAYEDGMARVFTSCCEALTVDGRLVIVFAHKHPDAWETLVSAIIRAGFAVDGSWPIQTEMGNRQRAALSGAALASSVWLVCKKRPTTARPGWDSSVLEEMKANIAEKLREFWDAGIRGPDFVWAATGPALEAYSKHPVVRKANEPNATMGVGEFLNHVRRMVVDYIVGQVLTGEKGSDLATADRLDEVTAYYLLHRHDFGMDDAPVGACILYATACGLSDTDLEKSWDLLVHAGGDAAGDADVDDGDADADADADTDADADAGGGGKVKLKPWNQRRGKSMGYEAPAGKAVPLIDRIHRVMHLWREGDVQKVEDYLDQHALRRNELFKRVVQSLVELARKGNQREELQLMEFLSKHIDAKGATPEDKQMKMGLSEEER